MNDGWMATITGKKVFPLKLSTDDIDILDVATGLTNLNRYGGQSAFPYSVAQHSVLMARKSLENGYSKSVATCMLLHDAHEIFPPYDVSSILKKHKPDHPYVMASKELEIDQELVLRAAFDLPEDEYCWKIVKEYDTRILVDEKISLFKQFNRTSKESWGIPKGTKPLDVIIEEWDWRKTRDSFIKLFYEIYDGRE